MQNDDWADFLPSGEVLPYGWSISDGDAALSFRDPEVSGAFCEADIATLFEYAPLNSRGRLLITCGYCGSSKRTTESKALSWFHGHACYDAATPPSVREAYSESGLFVPSDSEPALAAA